MQPMGAWLSDYAAAVVRLVSARGRINSAGFKTWQPLSCE